ncbi:MAG: hypothetical protein SVS85_01505, partial [Candidatus Nanohaloarchaea archaeon]|nr:hypothetical protein [Candidatus Nanohaloarchaea archaeon]
SKVYTGINNVSIDTGLNRTDRRGGSPDSRVIYTLEVEGSVGYGDAFSRSEGGNYTFQTIGGPVTLHIGNTSDGFNASNDALDNATARLVNQLDVDNDGTVDFQLSSEDLQIDRQNVGGIRWLWGPATVSLEVWKGG